MNKSEPWLRSVVTDDEFGGFRIVIPNKCATPLMLVIMAGVLSVLGLFLLFETVEGTELLWALAVWLLFQPILVFSTAMSAWGWEEFQVVEKAIVLRRGIGPLCYSRLQFEPSEVRNLHYIERRGGEAPYGIRFRARRRNHYFGRVLSRHESLRVIKTIRLKVLIPDDDEGVDPLPIEA
jgi:hypothetical protein